MPFTVRDFQDLLRLLQEKPEWREELRRAVLTEELLDLPRLVREIAAEVEALAEAQRRTEERLGRLEAAVEALAEAQRRTEERLGRLEAAVEALAEAQRRTEEAITRLTGSQDRFQAALERFQEAQNRFQRTQDRFAQVVGATAEARMVGAVRAWLAERGWQVLDPIESWSLDGETEIDGVARVARPDGICWLLVSAKVRAGRGEVLDFAAQLLRDRVRALLKGQGVAGKVLPVLFGMVARKGATQAAQESKIGLLLEGQGMVVEPDLWEF